MEENNKTFSEINLARCDEPEGFNMPLDKFPIAHFALGLCEEAGEVAGAIKKLNRGFTPRDKEKFLRKHDYSVAISTMEYAILEKLWREEMMMKIADELADVFGYLDLIASKLGIDWKKAALIKFNEVTRDNKFPPRYLVHNPKQI